MTLREDTTFLASGNLFCYLTVVQEKDAQAFQDAFQRVLATQSG